MSISSLPASLSAYRAIDSGATGEAGGSGDFGSLVASALNGAIEAGRESDHAAVAALAGQGDLTQVVTAVSRAQLALQTTVAVRDRVLQAYQDIIKMPI